MTVSILSIGTELSRGEVVNTNAPWLAKQLSDLGVETTHIEVVPDDRTLIEDALIRLSVRSKMVICTGGLGPTTDDFTAECAAKVVNQPLERDPVSLERIRVRLSALGRELSASNQKQADFPKGARILANDWGTAPGFEVALSGARVFFLPGVPSEMKAMFLRWIAPEATQPNAPHQEQIRLLTFGNSESAVNDALAGLEDSFPVTLGYRAHFPTIEVKILARHVDPEQARISARAATDQVRARLGEDLIFGEGEVEFAESIAQELRVRNLTLATGESCTGGLLGAQITDLSGASRYFRGGVIAYSNDVKIQILGVPEALIRDHGAVSSEVAIAMARGAARALQADVGVGITGVAGPEGGTPEKPVGLVHIAAIWGSRSLSTVLRFPSSRDRIRQLASFSALALVRRLVRQERPLKGAP